MKKIVIITMFLMLSLLSVSCSNEADDGQFEDGKRLSSHQIVAAGGVFNYKDGSTEFRDEGSADDLNYIRELEVNKLQQSKNESTYYISGEIENISDTVVDETVRVIIFNKEGLIENIDLLVLTLNPGEIEHFKSKVGEDEHGTEVLLQIF